MKAITRVDFLSGFMFIVDGAENLTTGSGKFKPFLFISLTNVIQLVTYDKTMLNFIRCGWYTSLVFCKRAKEFGSNSINSFPANSTNEKPFTTADLESCYSRLHVFPPAPCKVISNGIFQDVLFRGK